MINNIQLYSGIFWIITNNNNFDDYKILTFKMTYNKKIESTEIFYNKYNSKNGSNYNHKITWENEVQNNPTHKLYNKKPYNYYPRGRVELSSNKAIIYLNPHIIETFIIDEIKRKFGLTPENILKCRIIADKSSHYFCWMDII